MKGKNLNLNIQYHVFVNSENEAWVYFKKKKTFKNQAFHFSVFCCNLLFELTITKKIKIK